MDAIKAFLLSPWQGAPIWAWLTFCAVVGVEFVLKRIKSVKANSLLETLGNAATWAQSTLLGKFPPLALLLTILGYFRSPSIGITETTGTTAKLTAFLPFLLLPALMTNGCATSGTPPGSTLAQKVQADSAAIKWMAADIETKCGASYVPLTPVIVGALTTIGTAPSALTVIMAAVAAAPAIYADGKAVWCAIQTVTADLQTLRPAAYLMGIEVLGQLAYEPGLLPKYAVEYKVPPACDSTGELHIEGACREVTCDDDDVDCYAILSTRRRLYTPSPRRIWKYRRAS